jgi:uncharacterized protein
MNHSMAQSSPEPYKIVFQMVSGDTTAHKAFMKQLNNILTTAPDTKIEVICHGPALDILVTDRSIAGAKIQQFIQKGVVFNACEFSMSERKVDHSQILPGVTYVKAGILAVVELQRQGYYYIKAGF